MVDNHNQISKLKKLISCLIPHIERGKCIVTSIVLDGPDFIVNLRMPHNVDKRINYDGEFNLFHTVVSDVLVMRSSDPSDIVFMLFSPYEIKAV